MPEHQATLIIRLNIGRHETDVPCENTQRREIPRRR